MNYPECLILFAVRSGKNLIATFDAWSGFTVAGELVDTNGGSVNITCENKTVTITNNGGSAISIVVIVI